MWVRIVGKRRFYRCDGAVRHVTLPFSSLGLFRATGFRFEVGGRSQAM
jgi:hypothetical protein